MQHLCYTTTPLGRVLIASEDNEALIGLWFTENQKYSQSTVNKDAVFRMDDVLDRTIQWLNTYFLGQNPSFMPPIRFKGTKFRKEIYEILMTIPYGETMTYGQIADIIAKRRGLDFFSARAVGQAVGHNPISIIVPCHRVIGTNGALTGYAGGIERKIKLLDLEAGKGLK